MKASMVDALWGAAFLSLVLLGYGLIPTPGVRTPFDSFSEDPAGKKAFFLVAEELLTDVRRSSDSLIPHDENADTLVMLGPARYPDRAQWQTLYDWVSQGRALVFAARWQDPAVELEPFGIEVVPKTMTPPASDANDDTIETELVDAAFEWRSRGEVRTTPTGATDATVELSDGSPQVVWRPIGDGAIVVVASDYIFTNRSLTAGTHGLLAFRILETAAPIGPVYFDEAMNAAGAPRVVGILLEEPFRLITLQLLMVTFLFGWMASRRFGPVRTSAAAARRSLVEHAQALGNLHFKVGSGASLVASYLEFFRRELGLRHGAAGALERNPAAPRPSADEMDQTLVAARSANLSRDRVGETITFLARLRDSFD
ncbi:MAG: hypothetical protein BMS9Abin37_0180 [Acidobacteriota bacterium]|nr:MAG: hypothetical protein BMS9Abin37_0180 [Acidobacteriota bacterium]